MKTNRIIKQIVIISILIFWFAAPVLVHAAELDPSLNYLYGGQASDCVSGDLTTITEAGYPLGTHCLRLSNNQSTYTVTAAPAQGACTDASDGSRGVKANGFGGPVCIYFQAGTLQVASPSITFTPVTASTTASPDKALSASDSNCPGPDCSDIYKGIIIPVINVMSALVGVVVITMIIIGGIQYSTAGSDPQKIAAAKAKIVNALTGLVAFILMYAFLQWLVPGGIF
jgi:hypothetical protein